MADRSSRRKLAAILNADVVGYSRLMAADEAATVETLKAYRDIITRLVARHGGRVVNAPGDALLAEFPSAVEAVQAAIEIQQSVEGHNIELEADRRMQCSDRCTPVHCYRISAPPSSRRAPFPSPRIGAIWTSSRTGPPRASSFGNGKEKRRAWTRIGGPKFGIGEYAEGSNLLHAAFGYLNCHDALHRPIARRHEDHDADNHALVRQAEPRRHCRRSDDRGLFDRRNQLIILRGNRVEPRRKHAQCGCRI